MPQEKYPFLKISIGVIAAIVLAMSTKLAAPYLNISAFEDLYGKSVVFFLCSCIEYVSSKNESSLFELDGSVRFIYFFRVVSVCLAYFFFEMSVFFGGPTL